MSNAALTKKPAWLRKPLGLGASAALKADLRGKYLHTVCESAKCPNLGECFSRKTATFLILGNNCTRTCTFCAVDKGRATPPDPREPENVARMVQEMALRYVVITSVTRDDLPDGGAAHYVAVMRAVRRENPGVRMELLIPDFSGNWAALETVLAERPEVLNHNVETVPSLYPRVRPGADFQRSLDVLRRAAACGLTAKSGIMLGLGETEAELIAAFAPLKETGMRILTLGQYLAPSRRHAPVVMYYEEEVYERLANAARAAGIEKVFAGPFVRSSYMAEKVGAL